MSENKPGGNDPFEGLDWDAELENWDESTAKPGGAEVPESFSRPPPAVAPISSPPSESGRDSSGRIATPSSIRSSRPLYRPPPAAGRSAATPPAKPPPKKQESDRPLESLMDDADETTDPKNTAAARAAQQDDDDENRTVIAPVSQDLLAQLEAAGIRRGPKKNDAPKPAKPVEIDLGGLAEAPEERTEEHGELPAHDEPEPSVVTSAPEYTRQRAGARPGNEHKSVPAPVDAPGNGEMAVGWLCVSTFISTWTSSVRAAYCGALV